MTRMARTTPIDFLRLEAGLEPINSRLEKNSRNVGEIQKTQTGRQQASNGREGGEEKTEIKGRMETRNEGDGEGGVQQRDASS